MKKKLFLNSLSGTILYAQNVVLVFIMSPIYIRALGNRDYGLWELVMSVVGYMGLMDLGVGGALVRFVSFADGRNDHRGMQETISTAFIFCLIMGLITMLFLLCIGYSPEIIAGKEVKDIANIGTVFVLLAINSAILFPQQVFVATLMGVQRHYFINCSRGVLSVTQVGFAYYLLMSYPGRGLLVLAVLTPIFTFLQLALFVLAVHFDKNLPGISLSAVSKYKAKEIFSFGAKSAVMLIASRLQNQSVPFIIGNVIGLGHIVYFVIPNRLIEHAKGLSQSIGFPLTAFFGAAIGKGDHEELVKSWLNTTLALQIVSLAIPIVMFFCGEVFLSLWIGQEYALAGRLVLYILLVGLMVDALATNAFRMLTAQSKHGNCAIMWLILSVISIPLGISGAHIWGVTGVAAGTTFVTILANLITIKMTCDSMKVSLSDYFRKTTLLTLIPLSMLIVMMLLIGKLIIIESYSSLIIYVAISCIVYVYFVWLFTLDAGIKARIKRSFRDQLIR